MLRPEPESGFTAIVPALPGCVTYGRTLAEAHLICRRVLVLYQGRLLAQGTPRELFPEQTAAATLEDVFLRLAAARPREGQRSAMRTEDSL